VAGAERSISEAPEPDAVMRPAEWPVVAVSKDPNEAKVCVEDCWAPCGYPLSFEREALLKMRVVRWPAELA
jgi:hypothetical protein